MFQELRSRPPYWLGGSWLAAVVGSASFFFNYLGPCDFVVCRRNAVIIVRYKLF